MKQEDFALSHAEMDDIIANHYMAQHEYIKAEPYADEGAESWAGWAINCAMFCHAHLEDWNGAEMLGEKENDRYGPYPQWYLWCRASGQGNLAAARESARTYSTYAEADQGTVACFYAGEGETDNLIAVLKTQAAKDSDPFWTLWLATIYDGQGKTDNRDAALAEAIDKGQAFDQANDQRMPERTQMAKMLADTAKQGGDL